MLLQIIDGTDIKLIKPNSEKRVALKCDNCGKLSETTFSNYFHKQVVRGHDGITWCKRCATTTNAKKRIGKPTASRGVPRPQLQKQNSANWKGGRYVDVHGYVMVHVGNNLLVNSKWESYKKEHVVVMEAFLGRKLKPREQVHHIDGNKQNNTIENLVAIPAGGEHKNAHQSLQEIGYSLIRKGLINYDKQTNRYFVAHNKLRELLEHPDRAISSQAEKSEGSETRGEINPPRARGSDSTDDIVRPIQECIEPKDKEPLG